MPQLPTACGSGRATPTTPSATARARSLTFKERDGSQVTRTTATGYDGRSDSRFRRPRRACPGAALPNRARSTRVSASRRRRPTRTACPARSSSMDSDAFMDSAFFNGAGVKVAESYTAVEASGLQGAEKYRQRQVASGGTTVSAYFRRPSARGTPRGEAIRRRRRQFDGQLRRAGSDKRRDETRRRRNGDHSLDLRHAQPTRRGEDDGRGALADFNLRVWRDAFTGRRRIPPSARSSRLRSRSQGQRLHCPNQCQIHQ